MRQELIHGDCLLEMRQIPEGTIDLVYLDPPFFTQKVQRLVTRDRTREFSFHDLWSSHSEYAQFVAVRLQEVWKVLSSTGSVFFHCDRNASHVVRAILDETFGADMFRSEIIWTYRRWSVSQKSLLPAHQTIFFYSKSAEYKFNTLYEAYSPSTNVDQLLQRRIRDEFGKPVYDRDEGGNPVPASNKQGVPLSDVWDIPYLNPKAKERVGYPTQKPVILLERIVELVTMRGDTVLDPFCGSGTTLVAATRLGRNAVGIDISQDAIELTRTRLRELVKTNSKLLQNGRDSYRRVDEETLALLRGLEYVPVHRNTGIDAILKGSPEGRPVLIRVQRETEPLLDAADSLCRAASTKPGAIKVLIVVDGGGALGIADLVPSDVVLIHSPAECIRKVLQSVLKASA